MRAASVVKYADISVSASSSSSTVKPSARRFASVCSADGWDVPLASGLTAVQKNEAPSRADSRYTRGAIVAVQCECTSSGSDGAAARNAGTSVRTRSGVRRPPGSLRLSTSTSALAAISRARAA